MHYLNESRRQGDYLIVGINEDETVKKLKGSSRPINNLQHRKYVLQSLECVDLVIPFSEETPNRLIHEIKPDILTKGADYSLDEIAGADFVLSYGGIVKTIDLVEGFSTTSILKSIKRS